MAEPVHPQIKHLFIIVLENEDAEETFGTNPPSPYLGKTLPDDGVLSPTTSGSATKPRQLPGDDQRPAAEPRDPGRLPVYSEMVPGTLNEEGIALGLGCVYPRR